MTEIYIDGEFFTSVPAFHAESCIEELELEFNVVDETWTGTERVDLTTETEDAEW